MKGGFIEVVYAKVMDLAQRVGPFFGFLMGGCYGVGYGYSWIKDGDKSDFLQMCFGFGFGFLAAGLGRAQKKQTDMFVASEAEKRLDPNTPNSAKSNVPQIAAEIAEQRAEATVSNRETK